MASVREPRAVGPIAGADSVGGNRPYAAPPGRPTPIENLAAAAEEAVSGDAVVAPVRPLLDAIPRIRGWPRRPRDRPGRLLADRGYDYDQYRRLLRARGIAPKIARKGNIP